MRMREGARVILAGLGLALGACAPSLTQPTAPSLLVPGGRIEGGWAVLERLTFPLAGPPLAADRSGGTLYAAYPFQLLAYREGQLVEALPLPGVPRFVRARPALVVGLEQGLFVPERGLLELPAQDAVRREDGVFWVGREGFWRGRARLVQGAFRAVAGNDRFVFALGETAYRFPDGLTFPLPAGWRAAGLAEDLYLLTPEGVVRLSPEGLELDRLEGTFDALAVDASGVWLLAGNRVIRLSLSLEER
ncbi:hypothetical protein [Marinithermus hydrothermalis]|uniref:Lipoprotein n=1 Tax=Marinithermus hydrothermalis (strain DSM 14884 / JCM 11576 / T1) TaxID=869210 RepID=F2NML0_MARHT|nr:hypothetical protein [Marinithermus hydrothermalis]AEB12180.1 hypothetical protein Marky_1445 [Marinithermus hydrothermalis DSM 14884]